MVSSLATQSAQSKQQQKQDVLTCRSGLNHKLFLNRVVLADVCLDLLDHWAVLNLMQQAQMEHELLMTDVHAQTPGTLSQDQKQWLTAV